MFNSFKCILLCNRTATKFHNHFYITSVCHNHGLEGEMRNLPGVFLASRLPRLLVPRIFFGHFSRDHPTSSRNVKHWRNNEVFITPFLLILQKKIRYSIWLFHQKGHYFMNSKFPLHLFHHPGNHATLLPAEENFVTFGIDRYIGIPLSPSHTNCPMSRIQD